MQTVGLGVIGAGDILPAYIAGLTNRTEVRIVRLASADPGRAAARAATFGIPKSGTANDVFDDEEVDLVVILTPPATHENLIRRALDAGKHVFVEKPLAVDPAAARESVALAQSKGLLLASAPDIYLGSAVTTVRAALRQELIGRPLGFSSHVASSRVETWHPNPASFYQRGAGPLRDWAPYHLSTLTHLLGPVRRAFGSTSRPSETREVAFGPKSGATVDVTVHTHAVGVLEFDSQVIGTVMFSFDVWDALSPQIEIYGTKGTIVITDPSNYDSPLRVKRHRDTAWTELSLGLPQTKPEGVRSYRGVGVLDMVSQLHGHEPKRASIQSDIHILDVIEALDTPAGTGDPQLVDASGSGPDPRSFTSFA